MKMHEEAISRSEKLLNFDSVNKNCFNQLILNSDEHTAKCMKWILTSLHIHGDILNWLT